MKWKEETEGTPPSLRCWNLQDEIDAEFSLGKEVRVSLISNTPLKDKDLKSHSFNFLFIQTVFSYFDAYYKKAIDGIKNKFKTDYQKLGLSVREVNEIISFDENDFPVELSSITFYDNNLWLMHFIHADLPAVNYEYGIVIYFNSTEIYNVGILSVIPE